MDSPSTFIGCLPVLIFWILPIWMGLRFAKQRNRNPMWMWFGLIPVLGWIVCSVLYSLPPLKQCPQCGEMVLDSAQLCRFCRFQFEA